MKEPNSTALIIELQFLPSLHYFSKLACYKNFYFERWENYNKGSFRNKCLIKSNKVSQYLIVPLKKGKTPNQCIQDVLIAYDEDWPRAMINKLQTEYGNYPYYLYYIDGLISIIQTKPEKLLELNIKFMGYLFDKIGWDQWRWTDQYHPSPEPITVDGRNTLSPRYWRTHPELSHVHQLNYFNFTPGHSILEALFSYGPEVPLLIQMYSKTLEGRLSK